MKTFSVAQGNVFLPVERPRVVDEGEGIGGPATMGVTLEFSEDPNDSSQCRLRLIPPNGGAVEAVFHRNGALLHTLVREPDDPAKPFETTFQTEERLQRDRQLSQKNEEAPPTPERDPRGGQRQERQQGGLPQQDGVYRGSTRG